MFNKLLLFVFRKDVEVMAMIYASLIIKGKKTFSQVPEKLKDQVRDILTDCECEYLIEE